MKKTEEEIIKIILDEAFLVHKKLGPGLLENVYKTCLAHRLVQRGLSVELERGVPIFFEGIKMDCGYRADIIVEGSVVIETKSVEDLIPLHTAQLLTYLRFLDLRYGLLLNFNVVMLKDGIRRVLNGYDRSE